MLFLPGFQGKDASLSPLMSVNSFSFVHATRTHRTGQLSKEQDILKVAQSIGQQVDHVDVLVNNSGCNWGAPLESYPNEAFDKVSWLRKR